MELMEIPRNSAHLEASYKASSFYGLGRSLGRSLPFLVQIVSTIPTAHDLAN